jgi:hypothetical protein
MGSSFEDVNIWMVKLAPEASANPSPSICELTAWIILPLIIIAAVLALRYGKKKQTSTMLP